jgi:formaldehyde-activating enzyme involved in methanogenesis
VVILSAEVPNERNKKKSIFQNNAEAYTQAHTAISQGYELLEQMLQSYYSKGEVAKVIANIPNLLLQKGTGSITEF